MADEPDTIAEPPARPAEPRPDPFAVPELDRGTRVLPPDTAPAPEKPRRPAAEPSGERFGPYRLGARVGQGGMAEVRIAFRGDVRCVVKRIAAAHAADPDYRAMFLEEARISSVLDHPNVPRALDAGEIDGVPYIALELLDAATLAGILRARGKLAIAEVVSIALGVARALEYVHGLRGADGEPLGAVHRDISPDNILVTSRGEVKLVDFGIARFRGRGLETRFGLLKGKVRYMAPEQIEQGAIDHRTDLFALGLVLAEALGATEPELGPWTPSQVDASKLAGVPAEVRKLILSMTERDVEARASSAAQIAAELAVLQQHLGAGDLAVLAAGALAANPQRTAIVEPAPARAPSAARPRPRAMSSAMFWSLIGLWVVLLAVLASLLLIDAS